MNTWKDNVIDIMTTRQFKIIVSKIIKSSEMN